MTDLAQKDQERDLTFTVSVAYQWVLSGIFPTDTGAVSNLLHTYHHTHHSLDSGIPEEPKHHSFKRYYFPSRSLIFMLIM